MRIIKLTVMMAILCGCGLIIIRTTAIKGEAIAPDDVTYQGIPPGFDFPADQTNLLQLRDANNVAEMRKHAWMVFAGMTQPAPGGEAIWETWFSEPEVFQPGPSPQGVRKIQRRFQDPRQFRAPAKGPSPQAVGASLLSFVLYNKEARDHIRTNQLYLQSKLDQINHGFDVNNTPVEKREIPIFPPAAVSLKTVWWIVKKTGLTAMPIWDANPTRPNQQGNDYPTWARFVAVDPSRTQIPANEKADILFQGILRKNSHVVPLASLYNFQITTQEQLNAIHSVSVKVPNAKDAQMGDYVVLVAMHCTTKEIPDWVWATFWWHDKPDDGSFAADRPGTDKLLGVWRNYLMNVAFSADTPKESDGTPPVCFNPWLEARFSGGLTSNCMACHQRAVWPPESFLPVIRGSLPANDQYFVGKTKADFLWSIPLESQ